MSVLHAHNSDQSPVPVAVLGEWQYFRGAKQLFCAVCDKTGVQPVETKGCEKRCKMAKYAMIGKAEPIPQNSRSTVCDAFDCLQDDLVTSQVVVVECTTCVDPE